MLTKEMLALFLRGHKNILYSYKLTTADNIHDIFVTGTIRVVPDKKSSFL